MHVVVQVVDRPPLSIVPTAGVETRDATDSNYTNMSTKAARIAPIVV